MLKYLITESNLPTTWRLRGINQKDIDDGKDEFLKWNSRLRGSILDMAILYMAAYYQQDLNPIEIKKVLEEKWGSHDTPMPTIYATVQRLNKKDFIELKAEVIDKKVYKKFVITETGWELLSEMTRSTKNFLKVFEYHDKELEFPRRRTTNE